MISTYQTKAFVFLVLVLFLCAIPARARAAERKKYNVILIVVDALRAGRLSCYGHDRKTSSAIDAMAQEGTLFCDAYSQATWTLPSFSSLLTSRYVFQHKVINDQRMLPDAELTLAEILKVYGYRTAAFTTNVHLNRRYNLTQGFDDYEDVPFLKNQWPQPEVHISETLPRACAWIDERKGEKFFLMLHANDVHSPLEAWLPSQDVSMYDPAYKGIADRLVLDLPLRKKLWGYLFYDEDGSQGVFKERDIHNVRARYDQSIFDTDIYIGQLMAFLKDRGLLENTVVVLTADHGVDLFDRGHLFCNAFLPPFEESIHVPLIILHPGAKTTGHKIPGFVQSIDILPTVLDALGIPPKRDAEGMSLLPFLEGKKRVPDRFIHSESTDPRSCLNPWECKFSIRSGDWKLLVYFFGRITPFFALYDLSQDPLETRNVFHEESDVRDRMVSEFHRVYLLQQQE